jgi:hypothetical protein
MKILLAWLVVLPSWIQPDSKDEAQMSAQFDAVSAKIFAHLDRPNSQICDSRETVEPRCSVGRNKVVLLSERSWHVACSMARLHLHKFEQTRISFASWFGSCDSWKSESLPSFVRSLQVRYYQWKSSHQAAKRKFEGMSKIPRWFASRLRESITHLVMEFLEFNLVLWYGRCQTLCPLWTFANRRGICPFTPPTLPTFPSSPTLDAHRTTVWEFRRLYQMHRSFGTLIFEFCSTVQETRMLWTWINRSWICYSPRVSW